MHCVEFYSEGVLMDTNTVPRESTSVHWREAVLKYLYYITFIRLSSPHTVRSYRVDLDQAFFLKLGDQDLLNLMPDLSGEVPHLENQSLLAACRQAQSHWSHLSPSTRNRKAACLKSFLNWLFEQGAIDVNLAHQIHAPKALGQLPHFISVDEVLTLLSSLHRDLGEATTRVAEYQIRRDLVLILLLYGGGLRVSEACAVRWRQIDFKKRVIRILGKGGKERLVVFPELSIAELKFFESLKASGKGEFVFGQTAPMNTRIAYGIVRARGARAGLLKPLHPHALRHSYATHLLASGANLRTLQELLGHATLQATSRYTHLNIDQLAQTLESFHPLRSKRLTGLNKPNS
jgi:integrase/recombinase XerC/integrase/recombinase XerD